MGQQYIICCDFDGVLHSYTSGWQGDASIIKDPPVAGAMEWLVNIATDPRFELCVYSSRSKEEKGVEAMRTWLWANLTEYYSVGSDMGPRERALSVDIVMENLSFPVTKPAASMTIDDRAFHFEGKFPTPEWLLAFQPWTKKKDEYKPHPREGYVVALYQGSRMHRRQDNAPVDFDLMLIEIAERYDRYGRVSHSYKPYDLMEGRHGEVKTIGLDFKPVEGSQEPHFFIKGQFPNRSWRRLR